MVTVCARSNVQQIIHAHLYARVKLLEFLLGHPFVPVRASSVEGALVLHGIFDHALAFKNLEGEAHTCVPADVTVHL